MPAAVAKTQQPTLAERFKAAHAELVALGEQLIEQEVDYLKACHPDLPRETLAMSVGKNRFCTCAIALEVVEKKRD